MTAENSSTFKFKLTLGEQVRFENRDLTREAFFEALWARFGGDADSASAGRGLVGLHEGTVLSEAAAGQGLETESWTLDSGEAPRERDWIGGQEKLEAELYFADRASATAAAELLARLAPDAVIGAVEEQVAQDWDAQWKASFTGAFVPPFWHVLPPWVEALAPEAVAAATATGAAAGAPQVLRINPGAGFGTGTHETTQLCLERIADAADRAGLAGRRILDFGSGSGILAIGAALLGADVAAVEIDPLAIDNSRENAALNDLEGRIRYSQYLNDDHRGFDGVIANILKPVLLEFAPELVARMRHKGFVILSGLIEKDVAEVHARYSELLGRAGQVSAKNEWRAIYWASVTDTT